MRSHINLIRAVADPTAGKQSREQNGWPMQRIDPDQV